MSGKVAAYLAAGALIAAAGPAQAGPPYFTDDPEPTDKGHWEIYAFGAGTKTPGAFDGTGGLDLNYGPVENVQLTATLPVEYTSAGPRNTGFGDLELGVKYRLFQREEAGLAFAIFPRLILPTARKGFGSGKTRLLLPLWGQKDMGKWSLFGGGGYTINPGAGNRNYWQSGVALTRQVSNRLSLGGEVAFQGPDAAGGRNYAALNFGGIYHLGGPFSILVSGGPGIVHVREGGTYNVYAALGIDF